MRLWSAERLVTFLFLAPALALAAEPVTRPMGVWSGNIGKQPLTACFNAGEYSRGTGSYYYQRLLDPIRLESTDVNTPANGATWREDNGEWQLHDVTSSAIRGTWSSLDKSRKLPIILARVKDFAGALVSSSNACGSDAYNKPLEKQPKVSLGAVRSANGIEYREITVNIGRREDEHEDQGLHMASLEILGNSPSVAAVNNSLRKLIRTSELFECRRAQLAANGRDGFLTQTISGVSVIGRWLTLKTSNQGYCATAHPDIWETQTTWNLVTGEQENLISWFRGGESAELDPRAGSHGTLPTPLAKLVHSRIGQGDPRFHLSREVFVDCYGDREPDAYWYDLALIDGGINFVVPITRNGSCGESITVTFKELAPFLNKRGRAAVAQFPKSGVAEQ